MLDVEIWNHSDTLTDLIAGFNSPVGTSPREEAD
jgi:hypothetical protein